MDLIQPQCAATSTGIANGLMANLVTTLLSAYCVTSPREWWPKDYGPVAIDKCLGTYDFIVIGSGAAGAVVAGRLSEDPEQKVLLIEAGGDPPIESEIPGLAYAFLGNEYDWDYQTISNGNSCLAMADGTCRWPKGKVLGGSTSTNGIVYVRGNSRDYDQWEQEGNPTWNWRIVSEYFKLSENFHGVDKYNAHGVDGPVSVSPFRISRNVPSVIIRASEELKYTQVADFVAGHNLGFGYLYGFLQNGRRYSTAKAYLRDKRNNLHVIKNAVAKEIHFDKKKRARSVTFVINGKHERTVKVSKEIIVSAGNIESPKLLMLSGIGPRQHLRKLGIPLVHDAPVGHNLHEHTLVYLFIRFRKFDENDGSSPLDDIYDQWIHQSGELGRVGLSIGAFISIGNRSTEFPDIQFGYLPVSDASAIAQLYKPIIGESIIQQIGPNDRLIMVGVIRMNTNARGTVQLASADYKDKPIINANNLSDEEDIEMLVEGIKEHLKFEGTKSFRKRNGTFLQIKLPDCDKFEYKSDAYWRCYVKQMTGTSYHDAGSVKMGPPSDPHAVVDYQLRVRGVKGLRVVDASIMPEVPSANPQAPVIMVGERGADFVKKTWNMKPLIKFWE